MSALTDLNNFMKNYPTQRIEVGTKFSKQIGLWQVLKNQVNTERFKAGTTIDFLIKTKNPFTGKAHGEGKNIPDPGVTAFEKSTLSIRELIATAGVTKQLMDQAIGGTYSWADGVQDALDDLQVDFNTLLTISAMGDGSGRLAKINAAVVTPTSADGFLTYTGIACNNVAYDFGWDNVFMLRNGMKVDVYTSVGVQKVSGGVVSEVVRGNRGNGVAVNGTLKITAPVGVVNGFINNAIGNVTANGDVIYLYDSKDKMPMGLTGLLTNGTYGDPATKTTFQGLTRANFPSLITKVYRGGDYGGTDGVTGTWGLSEISQAFEEQIYGNGDGGPSALLVNQAMSSQIERLAKHGVVVNTADATGVRSAVGDRYASSFVAPNGQLVPIIIDPNIPGNMIYGISAEDLTLFTLGDFDFLREYGEIWEPTRGNRLTNYEAPYGGYATIGAYRCDRSFIMCDLSNGMAA